MIRHDILKKLLEEPYGLSGNNGNLLKASSSSSDEGEGNQSLSHIDPAVRQRAGLRLVAEEIKKQENIEDIIQRTDALLNESNCGQESKEDVNQGWIFNFMEGAGKTYDDNLKDYWAKLLADEIRKPGSFSLRTLEVLRNISCEEAKLFERVSQFVFVQDQMSFVLNNGNRDVLNYYYLSKLKEAGLLQTGEGAAFTIKASKANSKYSYSFVYGNKFIVLTTEPDTKDVVLPISLLTQAGCELYELTEHKDNMGYLKDFAAFVRKTNPTASIQYGDILERKGHQIRHKLPLIDL